MFEKTANAPRREIELDFLRGLAILAVVDFHAHYPPIGTILRWLGLPALGWAGVDVFFVLSGFLVGGLLVKEWRVNGRIDSKRFLIRRGFKIWPQYYLFLIVNLFTGHRGWYEMWPAFLNIQNYITRGPAHLWSLAVEEHAYLLLVGFLVLASVMALRMRTVFWVLGAASVVVVGLQIAMMLLGKPYFATTHTRVEAIFYGVMLAILFHCRPEVFRRMQDRRWIWVGGMVTALLFFRFARNTLPGFLMQFGMANLIGVCALILTYRHRPSLKRSWAYRLVAWIGLYSYGIYLWHVSMMGAVVNLAAHLPAKASVIFTVIGEPVLGIALGVLMTKLIEFPALRLRDRWFPRKVKSAVEDTPAEVAVLESAN